MEGNALRLGKKIQQGGCRNEMSFRTSIYKVIPVGVEMSLSVSGGPDAPTEVEKDRECL